MKADGFLILVCVWMGLKVLGDIWVFASHASPEPITLESRAIRLILRLSFLALSLIAIVGDLK